MLISRSDRGLLANWWFTVDRVLLTRRAAADGRSGVADQHGGKPAGGRAARARHAFTSSTASSSISFPAALVLFATSLLDPSGRRAASRCGASSSGSA